MPENSKKCPSASISIIHIRVAGNIELLAFLFLKNMNFFSTPCVHQLNQQNFSNTAVFYVVLTQAFLSYSKSTEVRYPVLVITGHSVDYKIVEIFAQSTMRLGT